MIAAWWYPADPDISLHGKTLSLYNNNDDEDYDDDDNHNDDENDDDDDDDDDWAKAWLQPRLNCLSCRRPAPATPACLLQQKVTKHFSDQSAW